MKNYLKNLFSFFSKKSIDKRKTISAEELGTFYMNSKFQSLKDSSDAYTFTYEIWENKHVDIVKAGQMLPFNKDLLSSTQLDIQISFWKSLADGLSDPMLSFQGDIGKGVVRGYQYTDKRAVAPANTIGHIIKPVFEKDINNFLIGYEGKSLIYHTSPFSPTLREEIEKLNNLLIRFFGGEDVRKTLNIKEQLFHPEIVISKEDLDKISSTIPASIINEGGRVQNIPISKIRLDTPIRHAELPPELIERIKAWKKILFEVELIPLDKTIDDFRRDTHPEREVKVWEKIANAYQSYIKNHSVDSLEIKKEVYRIAFDFSNGNVDLTKTPHLKDTDVQEMTSYFAHVI